MQKENEVSEHKPYSQLLGEEWEREKKLRVSSFVSSVSQFPDGAIEAIVDHVMTLPLAEKGRFVERCSAIIKALQKRYADKM